MEINFCENCENCLFVYSENDTNNLYLGCKVCQFTKPYKKEKCIYSNKYDIDLSDTINENKYLTEDNTLPTIINNPNIQCPNEECISIKGNKPSEIQYIKYDSIDMKFMYVCKYCSQKWTN